MFLILKFTHLDIEIYVKLDLSVSFIHMSPNIKNVLMEWQLDSQDELVVDFRDNN